MSDIELKHNFGGQWTQFKLMILRSYLAAYSTALKNQGFTLHYADAFAGTGNQDIKTDDRQSTFIEVESLAGSVRVALEQGGFHHYHLNDLAKPHYDALLTIKSEHSHLSVQVSNLDANIFIRNFCSSLGRQDRAVLFVDPYASELEWDTLKLIAATKKVDVWFLFPFSVLTRLIPTNHDKLPESWAIRVDRILGTQDWREKLYEKNDSPMVFDLFGESPAESKSRVDLASLEQYISQRLEELFTFTSAPIKLKNSKNSVLFLLYFAISSDSVRAISLAQRITNSIIKQVAKR